MRLYIKYGIYCENIDVTKVCYEKCIKNNTLIIPKGVNERGILFGDPKQGLVKSIFTILDGNITEYKDNELDLYISNINNYIYLYPICFSFPKEKIVETICKKTKLLSNLIPGNLSTYIYKNEKDYYNEYQNSMFAITCKKAGWDCMRHYEILGNGCIPYFIDIENCPYHTMELLPKDDLYRANQLYNKYKTCNINDLTHEEYQECIYFINHLVNYTKNNLTTEKIAKYILNITNNNKVDKILYLSGNTGPDYLRCLTLHGFKQIFGTQCHDYPKIQHIYKENIDFHILYGKGITYTNLLETNLHDDLYDSNIELDIREKKYDIIIYGSYHRGMPFFDLVKQHYENSKIILLCGEDCHQCDYWNYLEKGHKVFVREL